MKSDIERALATKALNKIARESLGHPIANGNGTSDDEPKGKLSVADQLVELAEGTFRFGRSPDGMPFAVRRDGANVALPLRGSSQGLRAVLAREYRRTHGKTPTASSLADALNVCEGLALDVEPEPVSLRVARCDDGIAVDLGDVSGRALVISEHGHAIDGASPVLFRRSALTGELPIPVAGGSITQLRDLLNMSPDSFVLVLAWLVAAFIPDIAHAVLLLFGEQGTAKSTAAKILLSFIDPSPVPLRAPPRDLEAWSVAAAASHCIAIDNVSSISPWFADALCRSSTGDGLVKRQLYTDADVSVLAFRRCVAITSIDAGALRGDVADRLLLCELGAIPPHKRRSDGDLQTEFDRLRPGIFGQLVDIVSAVLKQLPRVRLTAMPRLADFAKVLAALDAACPELTGKRALEIYLAQATSLADEVISGDIVAERLIALLQTTGGFTGTATELLASLTPEQPPKGWPKNSRALSGRIRSIMPAIRTRGWQMTDNRKPGQRTMTFSRSVDAPKPTAVPETHSLAPVPDEHDDILVGLSGYADLDQDETI